MRNIVVFYAFVIIPLGLLAFFLLTERLDSGLFTILILLYALVYHPFLSGLRLISLGKISSQNFWKNFIPFWNARYFKTLYVS